MKVEFKTYRFFYSMYNECTAFWKEFGKALVLQAVNSQPTSSLVHLLLRFYLIGLKKKKYQNIDLEH